MGSSILTNRSAMTALQTLRAIDSNLDKSKDRISTGLRINNAGDNVAYWSISSMMKHDSNTMSTVIDAINLGKEQVSIAATAVDLTKEALDNIQQSLVTVNGKGEVDVAKLQDSIKANMTNISNAVQSSSFAGKNMLANDGQTASIAAGYRREGTAVYVDMIEVGGAELNFGVMGENGIIDMSEGVLQNIFGLDAESNFAGALGTFNGAEETYNGLVNDLAKAKADLAKLVAIYGAEPEEEDPGHDEIETAQGKVEEAETALYGNPDDDDDLGGVGTFNEAKDAFKFEASNVTLAEFVQMENVGAMSAEAQNILLGRLQNKVRDAVDLTLTAGAKIGSAVNLMNTQLEFVKRLLDNVDAGIGSMIDADMNAESAKLSALQVQQQLGVQALSIANQGSQNILLLFRN
ncbi:flagellin [Bartonella schoenbuchensis]|uniref:Flagellin n=1 Tax=Bartonella schoenbuchensis (strain DSM 13525 / NCTC 13165 / R1) TaxID=687861 RepID=E6Z0H6_BARSR|nr:flagellin [Bartonella schoenbuchensis]AQX31085.1 flagellin [Bartonella schoenbuchensis R1]CBI82614.1 Flagellin [Bartonella schoenbuchensis R1]